MHRSPLALLGSLLFFALFSSWLFQSPTVPAATAAGMSDWVSIGPYRATVHALAINPQDPSVLYAAGTMGIFKSTDTSDTWDLTVSRFEVGYSQQDLVVAPSNPSVVYAVTGKLLSKSIDGGQTWTVRDYDDDIDYNLKRVLIDPDTASTIYIASEGPGPIYRSTDGGTTVNLFRNTNTMLVDPQDGQHLYVSSGSRVEESTDGGVTWTQHTTQTVVLLGIDPLSPSTLYGRPSFTGGGLIKSVNSGVSWHPINAGLGSSPITEFYINPMVSTVLYAGTQSDGLYKSVDGGASWTAINAGLPSEGVIQAITADPTNPDSVYTSRGFAGLYRSTNGGTTWSPTTQGISDVSVEGVYMEPSDPNRLVTWSDANVYVTYNGAIDWEIVTPPKVGVINDLTAEPQSPSTFYLGTLNDGVWKTLDNGQTWTSLNSDFPDIADVSISPIAVHPKTPTKVFAYFQRLHQTYMTEDGGENWTLIEDLDAGDIEVRSFAFHPTDANTIYVGAREGFWHSTDGGATWSRLDTNLPTSSYMEVRHIVIDPSNPSTMYIGMIGQVAKLYKSIDGGVTWTPITTTPNVSGVLDTLMMDPIHPTTLYAAFNQYSSQNRSLIQGHGIWRSDNAGATWYRDDSGLAYPAVAQIKLYTDGEEIYRYAATIGMGVYRSASTSILTPTPSVTVTPSITPSVTNTAIPSVTPSSTSTATPSSTPNVTPSATSTATPSVTPSATNTATPGATETPTPTPANGPSSTPTHTPTPPIGTNTPTPTRTPIVATNTPTVTPRAETATPTATATKIAPPTPGVTATATTVVGATTTPTATPTSEGAPPQQYLYLPVVYGQ